MSHEPMFQISSQSVEAIQSYWSASAGHRIWVLMVVRENDLGMFPNVLIQLSSDS